MASELADTFSCLLCILGLFLTQGGKTVQTQVSERKCETVSVQSRTGAYVSTFCLFLHLSWSRLDSQVQSGNCTLVTQEHCSDSDCFLQGVSSTALKTQPGNGKCPIQAKLRSRTVHFRRSVFSETKIVAQFELSPLHQWPVSHSLSKHLRVSSRHQYCQVLRMWLVTILAQSLSSWSSECIQGVG